MSTRYAGIFIKGDPQRYEFLPNFWMKLLKPQYSNYPPNIVNFQVHMKMSKFDIKNYLEKIYNVPVAHVNTRIKNGGYGKLYNGHPVRNPDIKYAYVTLKGDQTFTFPDFEAAAKSGSQKVEGEEEVKKEMAKIDDATKSKISNKPTIPSWFAL